MSAYAIELLKSTGIVLILVCIILGLMFVILSIGSKKDEKKFEKLIAEKTEKFKAIKESKDYRFISKVSYYGSTFEPYSDDEFVYIPILGQSDNEVLYWKLDKKLFK